jgi:hypothetical protein
VVVDLPLVEAQSKAKLMNNNPFYRFTEEPEPYTKMVVDTNCALRVNIEIVK